MTEELDLQYSPVCALRRHRLLSPCYCRTSDPHTRPEDCGSEGQQRAEHRSGSPIDFPAWLRHIYQICTGQTCVGSQGRSSGVVLETNAGRRRWERPATLTAWLFRWVLDRRVSMFGSAAHSPGSLLAQESADLCLCRELTREPSEESWPGHVGSTPKISRSTSRPIQ